MDGDLEREGENEERYREYKRQKQECETLKKSPLFFGGDVEERGLECIEEENIK